MDLVYGLDEIYEVEKADQGGVLALQAHGEPIKLTVGNTLIHVEGEGQTERHLWNVVMALSRFYRTQKIEPTIMGLEGREGPQGLELLDYLDAELHRRLDEDQVEHPPIVAIFPPVDGLPDEYASRFQTLVMKSNCVKIHIITTAYDPGLLSMFFGTTIKVNDATGYKGILIDKYNDHHISFITPRFMRQDINKFKKSLR